VPWSFVFAILFAAVVLWAQTQDGGIKGVVERFNDSVDQRLDDITGSSSIDNAVDYLNERYRKDGVYPTLTEQDMRYIEGVEFAGLDLIVCSPHHMVVSAFTARGTQTHLLVTGDSWGKVKGRQPCPSDLFEPTPWTVPAPEPAP
jgi:hypothetical protein